MIETTRIIFVIALILSGLVWGIWLITYLVCNIFNIERHRKKIFWGIFWIFILFCLSLVSGRLGWAEATNGVYFVTAILVGALWIAFLVIFPAFLVKKIWKLLQKNPPKILKTLGRTMVLIVFLGLFGWSMYNGFVTTVRSVTITTNKETSLIGKKIALIADTHYGAIFGDSSAEKLVKTLNSLDIEFVIIAGDVFDWPDTDFEHIAGILNKIKVPVYYVPGNHEEYGNTNRMMRALGATNFFILENQKIIQDGFEIVGLTYKENYYRENFENNLNILQTQDDTFSILVKHSPKDFDLASKYGFDLSVAGHVHNGQMFPANLLVEHMYGKYSYGLTKTDGKFSYTTSGVGGWWPPERLGSQSEIVIIEIKKP